MNMWSATRGVLSLELTQRARSTRWRVALVGWFVVLVGTVVLQTVFFRAIGPDSGDADWARSSAEAIATGTLLFVLLVGLLVAPAQTSTSINGDRRDGVLALIQAAPVPASAVVCGKLLAAWVASLAFLLVSLPVLIWTVVRGGLAWWAMLLGIAIVALLLLAVSGMGLGLSALTPRPASSTMLAYLVVAALTVGLPLVFLLSIPLAQTTEPRQVAHMTRFDSDLDPDDPAGWCREQTSDVTITDTRKIAWLLPANPVVVISDALPYSGSATSIAQMVRMGTDNVFSAPELQPATCTELAEQQGGPGGRYVQEPAPAPGWKWLPGLAVNLLLGLVGVVFAHRRLRVPAGRLPDGVRIA